MWRRAAAAVLALAAAAGTALAAAPAASADEIRAKEYWLTDYGIEKAWEISQGEGVKVAIIDTGIDTAHPDLAGAVIGGKDVSGAGAATGNSGIVAQPVHGTQVATLLAGRGNNRAAEAAAAASPGAPVPPAPRFGAGPDGVIGVAPKAELLSVSAWLGSTNPAGVSVEDQIANAVRWAVDNDARVINMSLGSPSPEWPESWDKAFLYAEQKDVVIVAAAGNRGVGMAQVGAPATIPGVLTVAGLDRGGQASWDSSTEGISIGVAAPGEKLVGGLPGGGYADWSGTSGAAPLVSGVAALIRAKYPQLSAAEVINRILVTAKDAGIPGNDTIYGFGVLDAYAALTAEVPAVQTNPLSTIQEWIRVHRRADAPPVATPTVPPAREPGTLIPAPEPPVAAEDAGHSQALPAGIVLGFAVLALLILVAGTYQVVRVAAAARAGGFEDGDDGVQDVPALPPGQPDPRSLEPERPRPNSS